MTFRLVAVGVNIGAGIGLLLTAVVPFGTPWVLVVGGLMVIATGIIGLVVPDPDWTNRKEV